MTQSPHPRRAFTRRQIALGLGSLGGVAAVAVAVPFVPLVPAQDSGTARVRPVPSGGWKSSAKGNVFGKPGTGTLPG